MRTGDLNLLKIEVYDDDNLIYSGMCEDAPDNVKTMDLSVIAMDGKTLKLKVDK